MADDDSATDCKTRPEDEPDRPPAAAEALGECDWCGSTDLWWRNCKLLCKNCSAIVKSCADL
jgi:hypothetical protein